MKKHEIAAIHLKDFQFNEDILLLQPLELEKNRFTLVMEKEQEYLVRASTKRVIRKCCALFGTSLEESTRLSRNITQANNKLPISIGSAEKPFILFPTLSPDRLFTIWIAFDAIVGYEQGATYDCVVQLSNGASFQTNISTSSLHTQLARSLIIKRHYKKLTQLASKTIDTKQYMLINRQMLKRP